jgi:hypothetical protein
MQPYPTYYNQPGAQAAYPQPQEPRGRGARPYTGQKRGRKLRGAGPNTAAPSTRPEPQTQPQPGAHAYPIQAPPQPTQQPQHTQPLQYYPQQSQQSTMMAPPQYTPLSGSAAQKGKGKEEDGPSATGLSLPTMSSGPSSIPMRYPTQQQSHQVVSLGPSSVTMQANQARMKPPAQGGDGGGAGGGDDEDDAEELPVMADDVYDQGLLWQSQSKDNLKCVVRLVALTPYLWRLQSPYG